MSRALLAVAALAIVGGLAWWFLARPAPAPPAVAPPPAVVEEGPSLRTWSVGGVSGDDEVALVKKLAAQVPGVRSVHFQAGSGQLELDVRDGQFDEAALAALLARPGLGWTLGDAPALNDAPAAEAAPDPPAALEAEAPEPVEILPPSEEP